MTIGTLLNKPERRLARWLEDPARAPSPRLSAIVLTALTLLVSLPGFFSLPVVDRDEARFAQASRQMFESRALPRDRLDPALHTGGLLIPMQADKPRLNKPPLIYWLQSASAALFTGGDPLQDAIWMYRVPSLLAMLGIVLLTWRIGCAAYSPQVGLLAGAMMAVAPIFVWEAHQARADMVLIFLTTLAMWSLWALWRGLPTETSRPSRAWPYAVLFWIALALGVLTKGPITPMVAGLTILTLCLVGRSWRWLARLKPLPGLVLFLAIAAPWFIAVANHVGLMQYTDIIISETLGRSTSSKEGHWGPPGYHLVLLIVLFWPGAVLTGVGVVRAATQSFRFNRESRGSGGGGSIRQSLADAHAARRPELFFLAWLLPSWIVFELVSTKLPHYTMPLYPALAVLSSRAVLTVPRDIFQKPWARAGALLWFVIGVLLVTAPNLLLHLGAKPPSGWTVPTLVAAVMLIAAAAYSMGRAMKYLQPAGRDPLAAQLLGLAAGACAALVIVGFSLPAATQLWIAPRLAALVGKVDPDHSRPLAAVGYHEDSLVYHTRARVERIDLDDLQAWLEAHPAGLVIAPAFDLHFTWAQPRPDMHDRIARHGVVFGRNYAVGGDPAAYVLVSILPEPQEPQ